MHLDFLPADAETTEPRLVVELDDRSQRNADAQERDQLKDRARRAAGSPVPPGHGGRPVYQRGLEGADGGGALGL
jgi:hypothetical protein